MVSGGFLTSTTKLYSFLVVLSFPSIEQCNEAQLNMYADKEWYTDDMTCFITYKPVYQSIAPPLPRPFNLGE